MKFNEWVDEINKLQGKLGKNTLSDISETIGVGGSTITITLGRELGVEIDGREHCTLKVLRSLFTHNKEVFTDLLDVLTERVTEVTEAMDGLMTEMVAEAIPGAVLSRMRGDKVEADNMALLKTILEKRFSELDTIIQKAKIPIENFKFNFEPLVTQPMLLKKNDPFLYIMAFGLMYESRSANLSGKLDNIEVCLQFLANFEIIKERVTKFCKALEPLKALAEKE